MHRLSLGFYLKQSSWFLTRKGICQVWQWRRWSCEWTELLGTTWWISNNAATWPPSVTQTYTYTSSSHTRDVYRYALSWCWYPWYKNSKHSHHQIFKFIHMHSLLSNHITSKDYTGVYVRVCVCVYVRVCVCVCVRANLKYVAIRYVPPSNTWEDHDKIWPRLQSSWSWWHTTTAAALTPHSGVL